MSGIRQDALFSVTRITTTFADDAGINVKSGVGSAFWVKTAKGCTILVTNRHNLEPSIRFPQSPELRTHSIEIELRRRASRAEIASESPLSQETRFFKVDVTKSRIFVTDNTDCGIIAPEYEESVTEWSEHSPFSESDLADESFFLTVLKSCDLASFIGFAGKRKMFWGDDKSEWWDQEWSLPIARPAFIASYPGFNFHHEEIPFVDIVLVSGLSFSGASGSPVLAHQKSVWSFNSTPKLDAFESKVIGIMSGHWWGENSSEVPPMFRDHRQHSGISYFTRSTSIRHLIEHHNL